MQSLKSAARRGAVISVTALSALAMASCSAGHVTQTAEKVVAVDGTSGTTEDGKVAVRDVTILVSPEGDKAALKFAAINEGYENGAVTLESVQVDGQEVKMADAKPLERGQSIQGDSAENLKKHPQHQGNSIQYVETNLQNEDFGFAGHRPVTFNFSNGKLEVNAAIAAAPLESGEYNRDVKSVEGYTTEEPEAGHHH